MGAECLYFPPGTLIFPALALLRVAAVDSEKSLFDRGFGAPIRLRCRLVKCFTGLTGEGGTITMDGGGVAAGDDEAELDSADERSSGVSASGSISASIFASALAIAR